MEDKITIHDLEVENESQEFKIDSPAKADWAIETIKGEEQRTELYIESCKAKIQFYQDQIKKAEEKLEQDTSWLKMQLAEYIKSIPAKKGKTGLSLKLASGTIRLKFASPEFKRDEKTLIENYPEFVDYKPSFKWGEFKKTLSIQGEVVVDSETGEVVDGVIVEYKPERVEVE
jgi:hypothetical protein